MDNQVMNSTQRVGFDKFYAGELGQQLASKVHCIKAVYDFAVDGGAVGSINLKDEFGKEIIIPSGAIVKQVMMHIKTAMASAGGAGTIALTLNSSGDLKAAVDADTLSGLVAGIPVGSAATAVAATAQRALVWTIATEALTAGKVWLFVEVYFAD